MASTTSVQPSTPPPGIVVVDGKAVPEVESFDWYHRGRDVALLEIDWYNRAIRFTSGNDYGAQRSYWHGHARFETIPVLPSTQASLFLILDFRYFWPSPWLHKVVLYQMPSRSDAHRHTWFAITHDCCHMVRRLLPTPPTAPRASLAAPPPGSSSAPPPPPPPGSLRRAKADMEANELMELE